MASKNDEPVCEHPDFEDILKKEEDEAIVENLAHIDKFLDMINRKGASNL